MLQLIISILFIVYGLFTIYLRIFKTNKWLGKIDRMKEAYGDKFGTFLHVISYTVLPIVLGVVGIVCHFLGIKFF